jgi:hypothetical protein
LAANHQIKIRRRILLAAWPERSDGNPFLDRLPGRFDGFHRLDVERRRWRAREHDDSLPKALAAGAVVGGYGFFAAVVDVEAGVLPREEVGEDMEMRVEDQIIAEGVDGGDGSEFAVGEIEAGAEGVAEGFGGGVKQVAEELEAFAEDAA